MQIERNIKKSSNINTESSLRASALLALDLHKFGDVKQTDLARYVLPTFIGMSQKPTGSLDDEDWRPVKHAMEHAKKMLNGGWKKLIID